MLWCVVSPPWYGVNGSNLGTWELALMIAGPICMVCLGVMLGLSLWQQHKRRLHALHYHCPEPDAPDQPILGGVSLRDMIEMTTSGSGSGKNVTSMYGSLLYCIE